ncbi:MAG: phosphate acyltransferase PlsX [Clostridia bacterium]|nr:phosphate acyltransferase PlsX [Clostridia bacterium]
MAYVIALDAMGGDDAPEAIVNGAKLAVEKYDDVTLRLHGMARVIKDMVGSCPRIDIVDADEVIGMDEAPAMAVRQKENSSLVKTIIDVRDGLAQAAISAGSTGAVMFAGMAKAGRVKGIYRPALAVVLPGRQKPFMLLDCGANVDCKEEYLNQFAILGAAYMKGAMGVADPEVRLVNIGLEKEKGNRLYKAAYELMAKDGGYRFGGNVEAREVPDGVCDVVVADGFDGNLIIKYTEGLSKTLVSMLKSELMSSFKGKIGGLLIKDSLRGFKSRLDPDVYGGAPLLGLDGLVIKAHGNARPETILSCVRQAREAIKGDVMGLVKKACEKE